MNFAQLDLCFLHFTVTEGTGLLGTLQTLEMGLSLCPVLQNEFLELSGLSN